MTILEPKNLTNQRYRCARSEVTETIKRSHSKSRPSIRNLSGGSLFQSDRIPSQERGLKATEESHKGSRNAKVWLFGLAAPRCPLAIRVNIIMSATVTSGPGCKVRTLFFLTQSTASQAIFLPNSLPSLPPSSITLGPAPTLVTLTKPAGTRGQVTT